ncbi:MAG: type II toxin-antitoxin system HicA family toxin [Chloroflexota bacterium]
MPLYSSADACAKLRRLGFEPRHEAKPGSPKPKSPDWMWTKVLYDAAGQKIRTLNAVVPMSEKQIARGTMRSILKLLEISEAEFESA